MFLRPFLYKETTVYFKTEDSLQRVYEEEDNCVGSGWRLAIRGGLNQYNQSGRERGDDVRPISHPLLPAVSCSHSHVLDTLITLWCAVIHAS